MYAAISAVNSYNRKTRAGVHISLVDDEGNVMIPHVASRMIYAFQGMVHKSGSIDISNIKKLSKIIPTVVNNTISDWKNWEKEFISPERLKILSQLFNYRMATHMVGTYSSGLSRFDLYKAICDYLLNSDKMKKSGFHYITEASRITKFMKNDYLFSCKINELKQYIKNKVQFTWEEKENNTTKVEKDEPLIIADFDNETAENEVTEDILSLFS